MDRKNQEIFLFLKIIAFKWRMTNSDNRENDTYHWQSMCSETPLRFNISLREIFSNQALSQ